MANDLNRVILIGRLTRDAEFKMVNNSPVANFSLAVGRTYVTNGEKREESHFFDCVAWGKLAEIIKQYTKKGKQISVEGRLQQERWEKDGQKQSKIRIFVENMQLLGSPSSGESTAPYTPNEPSADISYSNVPPSSNYVEEEDDIF